MVVVHAWMTKGTAHRQEVLPDRLRDRQQDWRTSAGNPNVQLLVFWNVDREEHLRQ